MSQFFPHLYSSKYIIRSVLKADNCLIMSLITAALHIYISIIWSIRYAWKYVRLNIHTYLKLEGLYILGQKKSDFTSPRILFKSVWYLEHVFHIVNRPCGAKFRILKMSFSFFIKTNFYPKMEFLDSSWYFNLLCITINSFEQFNPKTQKNKTF